jgi:hypothetical protein
MQITINQNEIEQAIEDFVKSQVTINDDQKITMELKATRGETGFQAVIEITAPKPVEVAGADKPARKPRQPKVTDEPSEKNGNVPAGQTVDDAPETTQTQVINEDPKEENPAVETSTEAEDPSTDAPAFLKKGSIFGNTQTV